MLNNILFVLEGEKTEVDIVAAIKKQFFQSGKFNIEIVEIPAKQNIYMIFEKMIKLGEFANILEVLKESDDSIKNKLSDYSLESFSEIYLFFDFEYQQNNISDKKDKTDSYNKIVGDMLELFDNETENGKLYLSYPMVEALKDLRKTIDIKDVGSYKYNCNQANVYYNDLKKYDFTIWSNLFKNFINTLSQLYNRNKLDFESYNDIISPKGILDRQVYNISENNKIYIVSGFLEFLLDYKNKKFWRSVMR